MSNGGEVFQFEATADLAGTEEVTSMETVPRCIALVEVVKNAFVASKARPEEGKKAKLMATCEFKIHQPAVYAGTLLRDQFVLANEDFPARYDKEQFGSKRWKTMLLKAQVALDSNNLPIAASTSLGHMLLAKVDIELNEYQGRESWRNRIGAFYSLGEREAQVIDTELPPLPSAGKQAPVAAASAFSPPVQPKTPFSPPPPVQQAPVFSPPVQPPVSAAPVPPVQQPAGLTVACLVCNPARQIAVSDYAGHMSWHGQNPGKQFPG